MATGTGITAGNRALKSRLRDRKLPSLETRASDPITQASLETLAEHLRVYEGDVRAPKERFITLKELEDAGLIKTGIKSGYAYIAQALQRDVAQKAGSTANPSLRGVIKKDTSRQARTPGGGGGGSATNPIEVGKSGQGAKLNDNADVLVPSPAQREFLYYDGSKWTAYPLFKRENKWFAKQYFAGGIDVATLAIDGVDIDTYLDDYVQINTLTQTAGFVLLNRDDATNPALHVTQAGAGPVARFGGGTIGVTPSSDIVEISQGNVTINGDGEFITLKNDNHLYTDVLLNTYIRWQDSGGTDMAWIGHGSNSNNDLGIYHSISGSNIRMGTVGAGDILMGLGATGGLEITGSSYKTNPTGLRLGQYTATRVYVQAPASGQVEIWSDGTAAIATFKDDLSTSLAGDLYIDGMTAAHLSSRTTGSYGIVAKGETWNGFSCNDQLVFMAIDSQERGGIYDDTHNVWVLQWNADNAASSEQLSLYTRDNVSSQVAARTQDYTLTGNTSSFEIRDHEGTYYDAGYNVLPIEITNSSVTLDATHCGQVIYSNNTTTYTVTTEASSGSDFPIGGMVTVINVNATGTININAGSGVTLYWLDGTGTSTGNRTLSNYAVCNVWRHSSAAFFIWGNGLS